MEVIWTRMEVCIRSLWATELGYCHLVKACPNRCCSRDVVVDTVVAHAVKSEFNNFTNDVFNAAMNKKIICYFFRI